MSNMLNRGADLVNRVMKANLGTSIVYRRGATEVTLSATVGSTPFTIEDDNGLMTRVESRDYLIAVADFAGLPRQGDQIVEGSAVYDVLPFGGEPCWRYSDPGRSILRVHTKLR